MFTHYRTQGFIFKKNDRGEADRLFTVYTKNFGKLKLLAKAERKIKSKLRAGLEIFYLSEIEFIQGKIHKTLTDAILIDNFKNLRKDLNRLKIAYQISDVLDNLIKGQEPDEKLWHFLNEVFEKLNSLESKVKRIENSLSIRNRVSIYGSEGEKEGEALFDYCKLEILYYYFFWNLLSLLGYRPELYNCSQCQKRLVPEKLYFGPREGGVICNNCFKKVKLGEPPHLFIGGGGKPPHQIWSEGEENRFSSSPFAIAREGEENRFSSSPFAIARECEESKISSSPFAIAREGKEVNIGTIKILRIILEKNWATLSKLKIEKSYLKSLNIISKECYSHVRNNS